MALSIAREPADTPEAVALLAARDAESNALYPPESQFHIPLGGHGGEDIVFLVARENGEPIGCGALQLHDGYAELKSIYLVPAARGRRIGADIVGALEQVARSLRIEHLKLETGKRSPAAIRTYERLGYRRCARFGGYAENPLSVYMAKRLDAAATSGNLAAKAASGQEQAEPIGGDRP